MPLNLQVQIQKRLQELKKIDAQRKPCTSTEQEVYVEFMVDNLEEAGVNRQSIQVTMDSQGLANFAFPVCGVSLQLDQPDADTLNLSGVRTRYEEITTFPKFPLVKSISNAITEIVSREFYLRQQ